MASSAALRLTEAHRRAQGRLGARAVRDLLRVWPLLDPADLDRTTARWLTAAQAVVADQHGASVDLASAYYSTHRTIEVGLGAPSFTVPGSVTLATDALETSLVITGPVRIREASAAGLDVASAIRTARSETARVGQYHALSGGRDTIDAAVKADPVAVGYSRQTSGSACAFCAMLASRGPVYTSDTAAQVHKYHPGCACTLQPSYDRDEPLSPQAAKYQAQWKSETQGLSGRDALNAFRRSLES